jgi:hypothetical protein
MIPGGLFGLERASRCSPLAVRERAVQRGLEEAKTNLAKAGGNDQALLFRVARYEHALNRIQGIGNIARALDGWPPPSMNREPAVV